MTVKNFKNTEDVQDYFVKNVQKLLIKFNKRTAAWNEVITKSKKKKIGNKNILIFCWEDENKGIEVVNNNYLLDKSGGVTLEIIDLKKTK